MMPLPQLMLFAPCERVVLDAITNRLTLSFIWEAIEPQPFKVDTVPEDVPADLADRMRQTKFLLPPLDMIAVWSNEKSDGQDQFEMCVSITSPDGFEGPFTQPIKFNFSDEVHRVFQSSSFTAGRLYGIYQLSVKLRAGGTEEWQTVWKYPLLVQEPAQPSASE